jgi:hypothetical protein
MHLESMSMSYGSESITSHMSVVRESSASTGMQQMEKAASAPTTHTPAYKCQQFHATLSNKLPVVNELQLNSVIQVHFCTNVTKAYCRQAHP